MSSLARIRRHPAVSGFVAWTFLVWTTRIGNIWRDDALDTGEQVGRTALALSFTVLGLAVVATLVRGPGRWAGPAVDLLAAWTTGVWVVRAVSISLADHEVAFKVVHGLLAVVSVALAYLAARRARHPGFRGDQGSPEAPVPSGAEAPAAAGHPPTA